MKIGNGEGQKEQFFRIAYSKFQPRFVAVGCEHMILTHLGAAIIIALALLRSRGRLDKSNGRRDILNFLIDDTRDTDVHTGNEKHLARAVYRETRLLLVVVA